jgi:hypothetical protein
MNLYELSVPQFKKMLANLERWIDAACAQADRRKFDPNVLVTARLAPDMFTFARQVAAACDTAKFTCARLTGKEAPKHADDEKTLVALRARIEDVSKYLDGFRPEEFEGTGTRVIAPPPLHGKLIAGKDYVFELQLPNFYFHVSMAYGILRHNGIELNKLDFLGPLNTREP